MENLVLFIDDGDYAGIYGPFTDRFEAEMFARHRTYGTYRIEPMTKPEDA